MYDEYCGYFQIVPQDVTVFICTMCLIIGVQHDMVGMLLGVRIRFCLLFTKQGLRFRFH